MSIERELERIADCLEVMAKSLGPLTVDGEKARHDVPQHAEEKPAEPVAREAAPVVGDSRPAPIGIDVVGDVVIDVAKKIGRKAVVDILMKYGDTRVSRIDEKHWPAIVKELKGAANGQ